VWKEFDNGCHQEMESNLIRGALPINRHWIDVMTEKHLETFFG